MGKYIFKFLFLAIGLTATAQIGINTTTPDASAILDVTSDSQGFLMPRMDTSDRTSIASPAAGLQVYDTDLNAIYFFDGTSWVEQSTEDSKRVNHVLVKSEADFPTPSGGVITLDTNTLYEINGTIVLNNSIELNGAYVTGEDTNEDILVVHSGNTMFTGSTGGSLRSLTLSTGGGGGSFFDIDDTAGTQVLIFQNMIIANGTSVGSLEGFNVVFGNVIQYSGNSDGITYTDISNLLLNNQGWFGNNLGTYETLVGSFDLIEKVSGFSQVLAATSATGIDVSGVTSISGSAVMSTTVFYGDGSSNYVNGTSPYSGANFTRDWTVNCPGLEVENDDVATANFYYDGALTTGFTQTTTAAAAEIQGGGTFANDAFRFIIPSGQGDNRLQYDGVKTRKFQVNASLSVRVQNALGDFYSFLIYKNGSPVTESNALVYIDASFGNSQIQNVALNAIVELANGDYIEVYVDRLTGSGNDTLVVFSETVTIN